MTSAAGVESWTIGLDSWVLQDGNYGGFARGDEVEFAVEFWPVGDGIRLSSATGRKCRLLDDNHFAVTGFLDKPSPDLAILDVGALTVYVGQAHERAPGWVSGTIALGVDPFPYVEHWSKDARVPPLVRTWTIDSVLVSTAPFIPLTPDGPAYGDIAHGNDSGLWTRDPDRRGWRELEETDGWADDDGNAAYLLRCRLHDVPPKRTSASI